MEFVVRSYPFPSRGRVSRSDELGVRLALLVTPECPYAPLLLPLKCSFR
jgi:hypothetical protein